MPRGFPPKLLPRHYLLAFLQAPALCREVRQKSIALQLANDAQQGLPRGHHLLSQDLYNVSRHPSALHVTSAETDGTWRVAGGYRRQDEAPGLRSDA